MSTDYVYLGVQPSPADFAALSSRKNDLSTLVAVAAGYGGIYKVKGQDIAEHFSVNMDGVHRLATRLETSGINFLRSSASLQLNLGQNNPIS